AAAALDPAVTQSPASRMTAVPANESARPAQPLKVVQAVVVSAEPGKELAGRSRVVRARDWCRHATSLVRLSGYPRELFGAVSSALHAGAEASEPDTGPRLIQLAVDRLQGDWGEPAATEAAVTLREQARFHPERLAGHASGLVGALVVEITRPVPPTALAVPQDAFSGLRRSDAARTAKPGSAASSAPSATWCKRAPTTR